MGDQEFDLVIEPGRERSQYIQDLVTYRELFYFLAWRDILVRYKQTLIGIVWSVLRPVILMIVFTVVFKGLARLPSDGAAPYALMVFAAALPWQFFSDSLVKCSQSMVSNSAMVTKIYFPRFIVPASSVIVSIVDFIIALVVLGVLMAWYRHMPGLRFFSIPLFILLAMAVSLGAGLWFTSLNVWYRDFQYIVPFVTQLMLYVSPVGFSSAIVPEKWRLLYSLNPMVGVIDGFRWAILGGETGLYAPGVTVSISMALAILVSGIWFFRRTERAFADVI